MPYYVQVMSIQPSTCMIERLKVLGVIVYRCPAPKKKCGLVSCTCLRLKASVSNLIMVAELFPGGSTVC